MTVNAALRDYHLTRRSVTAPFLAEPGPDADTLGQMLTIASRVPDHGKLAPWRFVVITGEAGGRAGEKLAEIVRSREPGADEARLDIERKQFLPAPLTVGVVSTAAPHVKIPEFEQLLAAGNAAFNLVHAANAFGFGAHWVTRWYSFDGEASAMLGAKDSERFVGFIHIGTPASRLEDRDRPDVAAKTTYWAD